MDECYTIADFDNDDLPHGKATIMEVTSDGGRIATTASFDEFGVLRTLKGEFVPRAGEVSPK